LREEEKEGEKKYEERGDDNFFLKRMASWWTWAGVSTVRKSLDSENGAWWSLGDKDGARSSLGDKMVPGRPRAIRNLTCYQLSQYVNLWW